MSEKYSEWPLEKLKKEKLKIEKAIIVREEKTRKMARAKVIAIAKEAGLELSELLESKGSKPSGSAASVKAGSEKPVRRRKKAAKRAKVPPKYRNPGNSAETWTGRGKQPVWIRDYLAAGGSLESVTI